MSAKPKASDVLSDLAGTLDIEETLARFPGLSREDLGSILSAAAGSLVDEDARAVILVDGAARGNPGPAGAGVIVEVPGRDPVMRGEFLGEGTNNFAEYRALILGLATASDLGVLQAEVCSDSELLVKQMTGEYRVKHPQLRILFIQAQEAASKLRSVSYRHIPREENRQADRLANMAIDAEGPVNL